MAWSNVMPSKVTTNVVIGGVLWSCVDVLRGSVDKGFGEVGDEGSVFVEREEGEHWPALGEFGPEASDCAMGSFKFSSMAFRGGNEDSRVGDGIGGTVIGAESISIGVLLCGGFINDNWPKFKCEWIFLIAEGAIFGAANRFFIAHVGWNVGLIRAGCYLCFQVRSLIVQFGWYGRRQEKSVFANLKGF